MAKSNQLNRQFGISGSWTTKRLLALSQSLADAYGSGVTEPGTRPQATGNRWTPAKLARFGQDLAKTYLL